MGVGAEPQHHWPVDPCPRGLQPPGGRARLVSPAQEDGCARGGPACSTALIPVGVGGFTRETELAGDLAWPLCSRPRAPELSEQQDWLPLCPREPSPSGWRGLGSSRSCRGLRGPAATSGTGGESGQGSGQARTRCDPRAGQGDSPVSAHVSRAKAGLGGPGLAHLGSQWGGLCSGGGRCSMGWGAPQSQALRGAA